MHEQQRVQCTDEADDWWFDAQLPRHLQLHAANHFTPVAVARRAAGLLAPRDGVAVLDVGAGAGKFCVTAARAVPTSTFVGAEWRPHLAQVATRIARGNGLANVRIVVADVFDLDWSAYDGFYLFNPFAEQLFDDAFVMDRTIALDVETFDRFVAETQRRLAAAAPGTRIVTYHGFGAPPPKGYELAAEDVVGSDRLELWIKVSA